MKRMLSIALLIAGAALLAGCPKKHNVNDAPVAGTQVPDSGANSEGASTSTNALAGDANTSRGYAGEGTGPLSRKIIYFDFDKSEIKPEYSEIVTFTARALTANSRWKLKLEGNTDERGPRESNIGLGQRRAQALRRALLLQGGAESQVATVSLPAERP